jgi:hypothetical protein
MIRFRLIADFDQEEQYLNDMAQKGYRLKRYHPLGIYVFKRAEAQGLRYRVDYRVFGTGAQLEEYRALFQDAGWEHVCGTRMSGLQYFLPVPGMAQTEGIFSDEGSKAERYKRLAGQGLAALVLELLYIAALLWNGMGGDGGWRFWDVDNLHFTRGLWETVLTVAVPIVSVVLAALYGYRAHRAKKLYKNAKGI